MPKKKFLKCNFIKPLKQSLNLKLSFVKDMHLFELLFAGYVTIFALQNSFCPPKTAREASQAVTATKGVEEQKHT